MVLLIGPKANHESAEIAGAIFASGLVWWAVLRVFAPDRLRPTPVGSVDGSLPDGVTVEEPRSASEEAQFKA